MGVIELTVVAEHSALLITEHALGTSLGQLLPSALIPSS
jgi:hypothetical protein